tara:strand:+ start:9271 stop:11088 length:1818 start_codon:yes stop_codon:yes gene_type:complete
MPKIPLYEQQTRVSGETSSPLLDRSAEIQSIQQIANTYAKGVGNLASGIGDMIDNYERLEEQSAVADANREMIDFKLEIAKERDEVLKRDDVNLANYEEKYLLPKINEFKQKLNNKGYSPKAMQRLVPVIDTDLGDLRNEEQLTQIKIKQQQHVSTITNEANTFLRTSKRQAGVDILNEAVADGYILQSDATKLINDADKDYFTLKSDKAKTMKDLENLGVEIKKINFEGKEVVINQDEVDRWKNMDQSIKDNILAKRSKEIQEQYNKDTGNLFNTIKSQAQALTISEQEIRNAIGGDGKPLHPDLINTLINFRDGAVSEQKKNLRGSAKTGDSFQKLEADIAKLFKGESNDPKKDFDDIMKRIIESNFISDGLQEDLIDGFVDIMKTEQGYNIFVLGQKGVPVYGGEAETKAWLKYWEVYDNATTYMRDIDKPEAFQDARKAFNEFIKDSREAALGMKAPEFETSATTKIRSKPSKAKVKSEQEAIRARSSALKQVSENQLEFDSKGFLIMSPKNDAIINSFINKQFASYREAQAESYFNTALNESVPMGRKTTFSQYYSLPTEKDKLGISLEKANELRSLGILEDFDALTAEQKEDLPFDFRG